MAFDKKVNDHIDRTKINWAEVINKNIIKKIKTIFEVLDWDIKEIIPEKEKRLLMPKIKRIPRKVDRDPEQFKFTLFNQGS